MTQICEDLVLLPKVPTVPSSDSLSHKHESSSFATNWSSFADKDQSFHGRALPDFAQHGQRAYRDKATPLYRTLKNPRLKYESTAFMSSEQHYARAYNLYIEFLGCQGFNNYRSRKKNRKQDPVWPDCDEFAFFHALVMYPACGRTQVSDPKINGGKRMGRNERIGHHIGLLTGRPKRRKQVSSHLQVLRPYVVDNQVLLNYLILPKELIKFNRKQRSEGLPASVLTGERISSQLTTLKTSLADLDPHMAGVKFTNNHQCFALSDFEMYLCPQGGHDKPLHMYARSGPDSRLPDVEIEDLRTSWEQFPELSQSHFARPIGGTVLAVEATFALPNLLKLPPGNELVIYLHLLGPELPGIAIVDTITTFFIRHHAMETKQHCGTRAAHQTPAGYSAYQIPFCSSYWASTLARLGGTNARALDPLLAPDEAANIRKAIDAEFRDLVAVQQVTFSSTLAQQVQHHVTLRWQFRLAGPGQPGRLSWRQAGIPAISDDMPSPDVPASATVGSFSSAEGAEGSEPSTPDEGTSRGEEDTQMQLSRGGGLGSPIALRREGWEGVERDASFGLPVVPVAESMVMDMSFLPDGDFAMAPVEQGFNFADLGYGQFRQQGHELVHGHREFVMGDEIGESSQQTIIDPDLDGGDWAVISQDTAGLGLSLEGGQQQRESYAWMADLGVAGAGLSGH